MDINLRHLRLFLAVAKTNSITLSANECSISQPAATQAIRNMEAAAGIKLFNRTKNGTFATNAGEILKHRAERAFSLLDPALNEISKRLKITLTNTQLKALIAVCDAGNFTLAANRLNLAQPTVHRAITELEFEAGEPLFLRTAHGILSKKSTLNLAHKAKLAFAELQQAASELADINGAEVGQIVIGALPLSRSQLIPKTLVSFRKRRAFIPVQVIDGPYNELLQSLRHGAIDMVLGALRLPIPIDDIEQCTLFDDDLVIIASKDHPIYKLRSINFEDLINYPFIVALKGTPTRNYFNTFLEGNIKKGNISLVETASIVLMRELLENSDHLGFVSRLQALTESKYEKISIVNYPVKNSSRPIGITTRKGWKPTPAQADFILSLHEQAEKISSN
ncbi:LysR family transcriptional regulator [Paenochrobactrum glaciei]|uniref:LysR family transcriptional regulator n=1 Tax=Paenochrobactrum glaciei TaxID=486407 RepID=A0ABN1GFN9_9HYPH